jgi:protein-S-isoprenylcysteine O-methyltransferase Ste14
MISLREHDRPGVIAPPPVIFVSFFILGFILDRYFHTPVVVPLAPARMPIILSLGMLAAVLGVGAVLQFRKAGTNVLPERPSLAIATNGPYRFTRNPMYLGLAILYFAGALFIGKPITMAMVIPALLTIHFGVILREERYLAGKFGSAYTDYQKSVRRWV